MAEEQKQLLEDKEIDDTDHWLAMQQPFASADEANEALGKFWDEFYGLRNKYRIASVMVICKCRIRYDDKSVGDVMTSMHAGSSVEREPMAAWAYGYETCNRQETIARVIEDAGKAVRNRTKTRK